MAANTPRDYYEILGVSRDADADTIKKAHAERFRSEVGVDRDKQSLKYDYMSDKYLDSMGMKPSSAKATYKNDSIDYAQDIMSLITRKVLGK